MGQAGDRVEIVRNPYSNTQLQVGDRGTVLRLHKQYHPVMPCIVVRVKWDSGVEASVDGKDIRLLEGTQDG